MTYNDFQRKRTVWREKELKERSEDIASPRPPLNNSITDQAIRELYDRVGVLEALFASKADPSKSASAFSLPSEKK
jgi:hypothetical protein